MNDDVSLHRVLCREALWAQPRTDCIGPSAFAETQSPEVFDISFECLGGCRRCCQYSLIFLGPYLSVCSLKDLQLPVPSPLCQRLPLHPPPQKPFHSGTQLTQIAGQGTNTSPLPHLPVPLNFGHKCPRFLILEQGNFPEFSRAKVFPVVIKHLPVPFVCLPYHPLNKLLGFESLSQDLLLGNPGYGHDEGTC